MADATDSDSSYDSSSPPSRDRDWYARQWERLCDEVGTSDPTEALARVQALKREANRSSSDAEATGDGGLVTVSEVEEVFREMNQKMEKLRERNATLVERLEDEDDVAGPLRDLHQKTEQLLDTLDAATMDEARTRIQKLNRRLEDLYQEKELLAQAGLPDAKSALAEIDRLREERDAVQHERDQLKKNLEEATDSEAASEAAAVLRDRIGVSTREQAETFVRLIDRLYNRVQEQAAAHNAHVDDAPDDPAEKLHSIPAQLDILLDRSLPADVSDILGIYTVEDARELESMITALSDRLDRLSQEHKKLENANLTADTALTMIENMEAQLVDLYHGSASTNGTRPETAKGLDALSETLRRRALTLTGTAPEAVDDVTQIVQQLVDRLDRLASAQDALDEVGLEADEAVAMIESMEVQLNDLYRAQEEQADAVAQLDAIEDVLGISTREEAEELSEIAHQMEEQLTAVYEDKQKLEELGLSSIEDAVDMIKNMDDQLVELYEDKEALRKVRTSDTEEQSTFQQLEALYAERERLQQALGVSSATEIIELVESLNTQLDELYKTRDAEIDPGDRQDAQLWEPEAETTSAPSSQEEPDTSPALKSMEQQLEALYREKEALLHNGLGSAQEAVSRLQTQQEQLNALQRENHVYEERFDQLRSALGTANVAQIVDLMHALQSEAGISLEDVSADSSEAASSPSYGLDLEATPPVAAPDTLDRLDAMSLDELDALDVGIVGLSDDGTIERLNEAALQLPGLAGAEDRSGLVGKNFFLELVPSTNNTLFYGRFQKGKRRGTLDARFPYTFTSPHEDPQSFAVHLYRTSDSDVTWLLYRPS